MKVQDTVEIIVSGVSVKVEKIWDDNPLIRDDPTWHPPGDKYGFETLGDALNAVYAAVVHESWDGSGDFDWDEYR